MTQSQFKPAYAGESYDKIIVARCFNTLPHFTKSMKETPMKYIITKECPYCFKEFLARTARAKYCSAYCKNTYNRKRNPKSESERGKRYRELHPDVTHRNNVNWRKLHPNYSKEWYRDLGSRLSHYKNRANKRNIVWNISDEKAFELFTSPCYYCGEDGLGIDRVNSSRGYEDDNVVPCCSICNTMKMATSQEEFLRKVFKISTKWNCKQ